MSERRRKQAKTKRLPRTTKAATERPLDDIRAFLETGGMKPDQQLGLVLRFLAEDLDDANGPTWSSRLKGLPLRPLSSETGRLKIQWQILGSYDALTLVALKRVQGRLRAGINALVTAEPGGAWELPPPGALLMVRDRDDVLAWQYSHTDNEKSDEGTEAMIELSAAQLFAEHADRVRACLWCKTIFLAVKRQTYCTSHHAQLARDEKKKTARNGGATKEGV
jgi:hypothetical protein